MHQPRPASETDASSNGRWRPVAIARVGFTFLVIFVVQAAVCGVAALLPVVLLVCLAESVGHPWLRVAALAFAAAPTYVLFALCLMAVSAATTRLTGARTPADLEMRIADMRWPLLRWAMYMAAIHVVRVCAGGLFRGTPMWTLYLRMNGARMGRRVYVNSPSLSDHNLLTFGDDVVIGADVHLSGHTVERGVVKTGRVTLGDGVTVGVSAVVEIDVHIGPRAQVGALSFVPKHARLEGGHAYVGAPVRALPDVTRPA